MALAIQSLFTYSNRVYCTYTWEKNNIKWDAYVCYTNAALHLQLTRKQYILFMPTHAYLSLAVEVLDGPTNDCPGPEECASVLDLIPFKYLTTVPNAVYRIYSNRSCMHAQTQLSGRGHNHKQWTIVSLIISSRQKYCRRRPLLGSTATWLLIWSAVPIK